MGDGSRDTATIQVLGAIAYGEWRVGRPHDLVWRLLSGYVRRMRAVGLNPVGLPGA